MCHMKFKNWLVSLCARHSDKQFNIPIHLFLKAESVGILTDVNNVVNESEVAILRDSIQGARRRNAVS